MQRLVLAYKNFAAHQNISHIGLGVSALNTCKVLRRGGVTADVWPVVNAKDLSTRLALDPGNRDLQYQAGKARIGDEEVAASA